MPGSATSEGVRVTGETIEGSLRVSLAADPVEDVRTRNDSDPFVPEGLPFSLIDADDGRHPGAKLIVELCGLSTRLFELVVSVAASLRLDQIDTCGAADDVVNVSFSSLLDVVHDDEALASEQVERLAN